MSRRRKKQIPQHKVELVVDSLSHDGRGVGRLDGKAVFVEGALAGEKVCARYVDTHSKFDELVVESVLESASERVEPPCPHAALCGGCSLQHMAPAAQIQMKGQVLAEQFKHFGDLQPDEYVSPLLGPEVGYRRKARLGVRYVTKRDEVLVGFREKRSSFLTDISQCPVLDRRIGEKIVELRQLIRGLSVFRQLPQVEVAAGDDEVALVFRHMAPLTDSDLDALIQFGEQYQFSIYLQPKGPNTVHKIWPDDGQDRLNYKMSAFDLEMQFHPMDFTQVNVDINRNMVAQAIEWLDLTPEDRVLDLFCGLGNFTLPLARRAGQVVGVEGDEAMVVRGRENASHNGLTNVDFFGADLHGDFTQSDWAKEGFDKILIDPPRSGALEIVKYLPAFGAQRLVYVSCNPATLARDAGVLVEHGYKMLKAGVMDMFPHTTHVESIALFERESK